MGHSYGVRDGCRRAADVRRRVRHRTPARLSPEFDALEARQLPSNAAAPLSGFLSPGAAEVATATSVVSSGAGPTFSKYASDLQKVEQSSRVTPAQFEGLQADGAALAQEIESSNLASVAVTQQLVELQDVLDQSFLATKIGNSGWTQLQQQLDNALYGVIITNPAQQVTAQQTLTQMQVVARAAHATAADHQELVADEKAVMAALGPNVDSNLGGATPRDPLVVYYNGQVTKFAHKR
jgi:hypothetical protein